MKIRIYFEDTDCGKIVYHTNYIKYAERARSELFFARGVRPYAGDAGFAVRQISAHFHAPARLGDVLEVRTMVKNIKNASCVAEQKIYKIYNNLSGETCEILVFSADITLAFIDTIKGTPRKIPPEMKELLESMTSADL